jgi:hypothetical protein
MEKRPWPTNQLLKENQLRRLQSGGPVRVDPLPMHHGLDFGSWSIASQLNSFHILLAAPLPMKWAVRISIRCNMAARLYDGDGGRSIFDQRRIYLEGRMHGAPPGLPSSPCITSAWRDGRGHRWMTIFQVVQGKPSRITCTHFHSLTGCCRKYTSHASPSSNRPDRMRPVANRMRPGKATSAPTAKPSNRIPIAPPA